MTPPKVFISYSHDSASHKEWVISFAAVLRGRGIDVSLDQWDLKPGDDLPHFMETQVSKADFILMICTQRYAAKADAGAGGVGYEKMIMTTNLLAHIDSNKVIPILRESSLSSVPGFVKTKLYIDFSRDEDIEYAFDELLRTLLNAPLFEKPEIGSNPFRPLEQSRPDRTSEGVRQVVRDVVEVYKETAEEYVRYQRVVEVSPLSRVTLDYYAQIAIDRKLIARHPNYFTKVKLLPSGLEYVYEHGIGRT